MKYSLKYPNFPIEDASSSRTRALGNLLEGEIPEPSDTHQTHSFAQLKYLLFFVEYFALLEAKNPIALTMPLIQNLKFFTQDKKLLLT